MKIQYIKIYEIQLKQHLQRIFIIIVYIRKESQIYDLRLHFLKLERDNLMKQKRGQK